MASVIRGDDNFDSSDVGVSTTFGAVGTYILGIKSSNTAENSTVSGSSLKVSGFSLLGYPSENNIQTAYGNRSNTSLSGTWRAMANAEQSTYSTNVCLYVRIS